MQNNYTFIMENGMAADVEFHIIEDKNSEKPFGIRVLLKSDQETDEASASNRFFTYDEGACSIEFLCKHQVTPCTLCDIL